jgi:Protein of unknown function (DUF664)
VLRVRTDDFRWFVDEALAAMVQILRDLGDDAANDRPELAGANSPYAIVTHCLGVMEFWGGHVVAGRRIERDRDAEFTARGHVAELADKVARAQRQLGEDLAVLDPTAPPRGGVGGDDAVLPLGRSQGGAVLHILEELTQHLGQMELTRDILVGRPTRDLA